MVSEHFLVSCFSLSYMFTKHGLELFSNTLWNRKTYSGNRTHCGKGIKQVSFISLDSEKRHLCSLGSDHNTNNFFVKTVLKHTFFKRSWHH